MACCTVCVTLTQGVIYLTPLLHCTTLGAPHMTSPADDLCPRPARLPAQSTVHSTVPHSPPIYLSRSTSAATPSRPTPCWPAASRAMSTCAMAAQCRHAGRKVPPVARRRAGRHHQLGHVSPGPGVLSQVAPGEHLVVSNQLYGRTSTLLCAEAGRLGIKSTEVDPCDLKAFAAAFTPETRLGWSRRSAIRCYAWPTWRRWPRSHIVIRRRRWPTTRLPDLRCAGHWNWAPIG